MGGVPGSCLAVGDCAADLCGDLVVQEGRVVAVDLDIDHCAIHSSSEMLERSPDIR